MTTNPRRIAMLFNIALIIAVPSVAQTVTPANPWAIATAGFADGTYTPGGYVFVAAYGGNSVLRYHGETGMPWPAPGKSGAVFVPGNWSCAPNGPTGLAYRNGKLYVVSSGTNAILRFNADTGECEASVVPAGWLNAPRGIAFGPDGKLYIANFGSNQVLRFDPLTGAMAVLVPGGTNISPNGPDSIAFGPDGDLYVSAYHGSNVLRYDRTTGGFKATVAGGGLATNIHGIAVLPDESILMSVETNSRIVKQKNSTQTVFFSSASLQTPTGLVVAPDGSIWVASYGTNDVLRLTSSGSLWTSLGMSPTSRYLATLNPARLERNGSDFTNRYYSQNAAGGSRLQSPGDFYDYARLHQVEQALSGVNRRTVLQQLFQLITAGATTHTERHLMVLDFLDKASLHNGMPFHQPLYEDGSIVSDPLVLLELNEMRCGHVARVAVDLFAAAGLGYTTRLVQLGGHVVAEIGYGNTYHYFDADVFGGGSTVTKADGTIPSVDELSLTPGWVDAATSYWEPNLQNSAPGSTYFPSYFYFSNGAYANGAGAVVVYVKTATQAQEASSLYYGWEYYATYADPGRVLNDLPSRRAPGAPSITAISVSTAGTQRTATLQWSASADPSGEVQAYRVFVARQSRGWNYNSGGLATPLMAWKSGWGWTPDMYESRFELSPCESPWCVVVPSSQTQVVIQNLTTSDDWYLSVMPTGPTRPVYPSSEEIVIPKQE